MKRYGPLAILLAMVPLLAFGPGARTAPTHWALIVGITDYIHFGDEPGGDLPGAEWDARAVRDVLVERWGFPVENIRMLLNHEATREAIEDHFTRWLPSVARPGDHITFYFAGHGSQVWDESGDEDDGLDETLAPANALPHSPDNDIIDDELGEWLAALPTTNVAVWLDNCHAGTATRDVTPFARPRQLGRDVNTLPQPPTVARRALGGLDDQTGFDTGSEFALELAAAQPHQVAVEALFPGEAGGEPFHGGAFTTFLVRQLWRAPAGTSYEEAFGNVREALKRNRFEQDPHLSDDVPLRRAALFSVQGGGPSAPNASLRVLSPAGAGGVAELAGGHALGVTPGSLFQAENGAQLLVEAVSPDRVRTRVVSGSVAGGTYARMVGYRFPRSVLRVGVGGIDSETATALSQALRGVAGIQLVERNEDFSHLLVRRRENEIRVVGMDGALRHSFPAGARSVPDLVAALKKESAAKHLGDMENPAPSFGVKLWLADGKTTFGIGEEVVFHALAERDGYLTLVDLGTDGTVTVLLPNAYDRDNRVRAGQQITFPTADAESEIRAMEPPGRGMVRAFLTPQPLALPAGGGDFTHGDLFLADLVAQAVRQAAGELPAAPEAVRLEGWGSASVVYDIRR